MRFHALDGLLKQVGILQEALEAISSNTSDKRIQATVSGFLRRLTDFDFYFCLLLTHSLFEKTDILSKQLQNTRVSTGEGISFCKMTKYHLDGMRNDDAFLQMWENAKTLAASQNSDAPKLPKPRNIPRRLDAGSSAHCHENPESYYRAIFFNVIDSVSGHIERRISNKGLQILSSIENIIRSAWSKALVSEENEDLKRVIEHYGDDLDKKGSTISFIKKESSSSDDLTIPEIFKVIGSTSLRKMIPEVCRLAVLYSVSPASTATCERSFSHLRRVKSYLRSTMCQKRLNHTCIMTVYKEQVDSLHLPDIVNYFIKANEQRRNTFAHCQ